MAEKVEDRDRRTRRREEQTERPATVRQDIGRPPAKRPARPDNIAENPIGQSNPPPDQR